MYGYKLKINSLPKLVWACETTVENYDWKNRNSKDMLEIGFSKFNKKTVTVNNNRKTLKNNELSCVMQTRVAKHFVNPNRP